MSTLSVGPWQGPYVTIMSTEFSSAAGHREGLENLSVLRQSLSGVLEKRVEEWAPGRDWGSEVVAEAWRLLAGRPQEIENGDRLRRQLETITMGCLAWRLIELVRAADHWAFERIVGTFGLQLRGMIRAVAGALQDSDLRDIEQEIWLTVWLRPPHRPDASRSLTPFQSWLRKVARSKTFNHLTRRSAGRGQARSGDIEWLLEQTQGGGMPPQTAIVAALHVFCNVDSGTIVRDLVKKTLAELFDLLQENKPPGARLDAILVALEGEAGTKQLEEFFPAGGDFDAQVETVDGWISSVHVCAGNLKIDGNWPTGDKTPVDEDPSAPDELHPDPWKGALMREAAQLLLSDVQEPHETLSYVLNRFLGIKPGEIVEEYSTRRIEHILEEQSCELAAVFPFIPAQDWSDYLRPLQASLERARPRGRRSGDISLRDFYQSETPKEQAREVTDWVRDVDRRFLSKIHAEEEVFLRVVFNGRGQAWEKLVFVFHEILKVPGDYLRCISRVAAEFLTEVFLAAYNRKPSPGRRLAAGRLQSCLREFRMVLKRPVRAVITDAEKITGLLAKGTGTVDLLTFYDFLSGASRFQKKDELLEWSAAVRARVAEDLKQRHLGLIYAYVCAGF